MNQSKNLEFPLISIFMPTYMHEKFIDDAVMGALNQSYENIEVVISDDGSTDKTGEILRNLKNKYPTKIALNINEKNLGLRYNANICLKMCKGAFIVITSGDDVMYPEKVANQLNEFIKNPNLVLCGHKSHLIDERNNILGVTKLRKCKGIGFIDFLRGMVNTNSISVMVKSSRIPEFGFSENLYAAEKTFFYDILKNDGEYLYIDKILSAYRRHPSNMSKGKNQLIYINTNDMILNYKILMERHPYYKNEIKNYSDFDITSSKIIHSYHDKNFLNLIFLIFKQIFKHPIFSFKSFSRIFYNKIKNIYS